MPPPPPPPPGAPPPPSLPAFAPSSGGGKKGDRKDLLKDIQQGRRLKPTQTNDRSGPSLGGKPSSAPSGGGTSGGGSPVKNQDVGGSSQVTRGLEYSVKFVRNKIRLLIFLKKCLLHFFLL